VVVFPKRNHILEEIIDGFVVSYEERDTLTQVSALLVPVGALAEDKEREGLAHLIEHMVFRGTKSFPNARAIMMAAEGSGGRINAYTTYDYMVFLVQMPTTKWQLSLQLLFELAFFPLFREEDLEVEKEVVLREMAMIDDDPSEKAAVLFQKAMWGEHRLGYDVIGFPDVVKSISREGLVSFWKEKFFQYPIYFTTIGSVPYEDIKAYIQHMDMPSWWYQEKKAPWSDVDMAKFVSEQIYKKEDTNQTYYRVGIELYPYRTEQWREKKYHISLISAILGGTSFSHLVQEIRDKKGWAYSIGATVSGSVAGTSLVWYMDIMPGVLGDVKEIWHKEVSRLKNGEISDEEFNRVKTYVIGSTMMSSDSMYSTALAHLMNVAFNGGLWDPVKDVKKLESLTLGDVAEEFSYLMDKGEPSEVVYGSEGN